MYLKLDLILATVLCLQVQYSIIKNNVLITIKLPKVDSEYVKKEAVIEMQ